MKLQRFKANSFPRLQRIHITQYHYL